jgi:hypothetical protein
MPRARPKLKRAGRGVSDGTRGSLSETTSAGQVWLFPPQGVGPGRSPLPRPSVPIEHEVCEAAATSVIATLFVSVSEGLPERWTCEPISLVSACPAQRVPARAELAASRLHAGLRPLPGGGAGRGQTTRTAHLAGAALVEFGHRADTRQHRRPYQLRQQHPRILDCRAELGIGSPR